MELLCAYAKIRSSGKWKDRFCVLEKPSPVADCLVLRIKKNGKFGLKAGEKAFVLESFFGLESGFLFDKESNTLALICAGAVHTLAFHTFDELIVWERAVRGQFGYGCQFNVHSFQVPPAGQVPLNAFLRLHVSDGQFCLVRNTPAELCAFFKLSQLRRFGLLHSKFCFEVGNRAGRACGVYVFVSSQHANIERAFHLAAGARLSNELRSDAFHRFDREERERVDDFFRRRGSSSSSTGASSSSASQSPSPPAASPHYEQMGFFTSATSPALATPPVVAHFRPFVSPESQLRASPLAVKLNLIDRAMPTPPATPVRRSIVLAAPMMPKVNYAVVDEVATVAVRKAIELKHRDWPPMATIGGRGVLRSATSMP